MRTWVFALVCSAIFFLNTSGAEVLCAKTSAKANKRTGAVAFANNLKVADGSCPRGYKEILNTTVFAGPQGVPGTFDPTKCFKRESTAGGSGVVSATTACLVSEIVVATGCHTTSTLGYVRETILSNGSNSEHPDLYGLFTCIMEDLGGAFHTVTAQAMCCRP